jgi:hypothetical protein
MKVKKFKNLWSMGLILFGAILVLFYIAKIFFPQFIVGVAEIPSVVKFGNYVDSHKWANILFHFAIAFIGGYFYYCACCRTYKLTTIQVLIYTLSIIVSIFLQNFLPTIYTPYTYTIMVFVPFLLLLSNKSISKDTFYSVCICFAIDIMSQALSLQIRDIFIMAKAVNSATLTILAIDTIIWRILLYLYFNYKNKGDEKNGLD